MIPRLLPLLLIAATAPVQSPPAPAAMPSGYAYADVADLVLAAPVVAVATIRSTVKLKGADATGVPAGRVRLYVEADVDALIRGSDGVPPRVGWLYDVGVDARGRVPQFKKARVLIFARPAPTAGQLQLVAPDAQLGWTSGLDAQVRAVTHDALARDTPPRVTGVASAFHVAGALPGEGETQLFLQTADGHPVSLSVLRRPGERPRWAVALAEIVDESAAPPLRDTLLWYRLACFLPRALPPGATGEAAADDAAASRADYAFVLAQLGPCGRTRD